MIHLAGKEREEDWVGIQCVAWFAWSPGHYDNAAPRAGVTLLRSQLRHPIKDQAFFFFASLLLCLPKTDYRDKGRDHNRRLESRGCERLLCDAYSENLAASSKKSIQYIADSLRYSATRCVQQPLSSAPKVRPRWLL